MDLVSLEAQRRESRISWLFVGILFALCTMLGVLQYGWIDDVSIAARDRMRATLQASLNRISTEFDAQIAIATRALASAISSPDPAKLEAEIGQRYLQWKGTRHGQMFRRFALATRGDDALVLRMPNPRDGHFESVEWPGELEPIRNHIELMAARGPRGFRPVRPEDQGSTFEVPVFPAFAMEDGPGRPADRDPGNRVGAWLIFDLDEKHIADSVLPELVQHHLGSDYQVEIASNADRSKVVYRSDAGIDITRSADASTSLFDIPPDLLRPRPAGGEFAGRGPGRGGPRNPASGRWWMFVRHRAGSLESVVARTRARSLAVTGGLLLLIIASGYALLTFTRRAQRLAQLQMDFVAGVSHELRTPLTVIHTAAYNLQTVVTRNPEQVAKYGTLIRQESGRLKELVEQVLSFAGMKAGRVIQETQALSVEDVIEAGVESSRVAIEGAHCVVEKKIEPGLPLIEGDPRALKHALQNLLSNAAKYGTGVSNWIGVSAARAMENGKPVVEIKVTDRGPGIPRDEQAHIFDPFFRGKRALQDQIHGTGLGLSLVREIVTAHRGNIAVHSEKDQGTEFVIRIPAAAEQHQDEFANLTGRR
jgi:signal transduction histidine kinase